MSAILSTCVPSVPTKISSDKITKLNDIANNIRLHAIRATTSAGAGHLTSAASIAEILSVLFFDSMVYSPDDFSNPGADRFVMSKGHGCAALYGALVEAGCYPEAELDKFRTLDSPFEGNLTPRLKEVDVATGSLGIGLSQAAGMAYVGKYIDFAPYTVYCVIGDGETQEGSIWEAISFANYYNLENLVPIFDINRLGEVSPTILEHDMHAYQSRLEAFGWRVIIVDGHDVVQLSTALREARKSGHTTCVLAKTYKGRSIPDVENKEHWHGKALSKEESERAIKVISQHLSSPEASVVGSHQLVPTSPPLVELYPPVDLDSLRMTTLPAYQIGTYLSTCDAYGLALVMIGTLTNRILVFDCDVKTTTMSSLFEIKYPRRFVECFIAEQNMIGVATGAACRDRAVVFASAYASFLTRAYDQIRVAAISNSNINICGAVAGISMCGDGPSQMGLEDFAMFRALPNCTIFYPSDAVSCERAVELAARTKGVTYMRTTQFPLPIVYSSNERFAVGHAKVLRKPPQGKASSCVVIAAGITLKEALESADELAKRDCHVTVIDPFTIKPIDFKRIAEAVVGSGGKLVVVEDHYESGGIGDAVLAALTIKSKPPVSIKEVRHLAVREIPHSCPNDVVLAHFGLDAKAITKAVEDVCQLSA